MKINQPQKKPNTKLHNTGNSKPTNIVKDKKKIKNPAIQELPSWFRPYAGIELKNKLEDSKKLFLYFPWIAQLGDTLIAHIDGGESYSLAPFDLVVGIHTKKTRRSVSLFASKEPYLFRRMVIRRLVPLRKKIQGFIFTFDWSPAMRIVANVCADLDIPTILIPHESVFVDRSKYYWDKNTKSSVPTADFIFGWGKLQNEIFAERGYPVERFMAVGAPKFDIYKNYSPQLSRAQFCRLFGFAPDKKIILFASQPLDSQIDTKVARESQRQAIADLLDYAEENECQVLVRLPPSGDPILNASLKKRIEISHLMATDDAQCYLVAPEEALFHANVVVSINSTMLFEGILLGRPALSMKYVEFDQLWEHVGIPAVQSPVELKILLDTMLTKHWECPRKGLLWAAQMFGVGKFDGLACTRIKQQLVKISEEGLPHNLGQRPSPIERLFTGMNNDVIAIPSSDKILNGVQSYLPKLLRAQTCVNSSKGLNDTRSIASVDLFFQWGITPNDKKQKQLEAARKLGKPVVIIEDGFIRSIDIGLSGEPALSIILDDTTAYYDATRPSRLQKLLEKGPNLTHEQNERSLSAIRKIVDARVSKYNHAPDLSLNIGRPDRKKVLLIDQRFGDQSVISGLADEHSFERMLNDVMREYSKYDIIIKQHPDAIRGGKSSYFNDKKLSFAKYKDNIHLINFDINPYSLFDIADEVFVVTSGMGFEALLAGKNVHCYGAPFYAGWGCTTDHITIPKRTRRRRLEEIFYFSYIESSRYYHPGRNEVVEVEELVDYIVDKRPY